MAAYLATAIVMVAATTAREPVMPTSWFGGRFRHTHKFSESKPPPKSPMSPLAGQETSSQLTEMASQLEDTSGYMGIWKMTFATSDPVSADAFSVRYLGGSHYEFTQPIPAQCATLNWVNFQPSQTHAIPDWPTEAMSDFQLHFVKQNYRPEGPFGIKHFENTVTQQIAQFNSDYNVFMDTRVVMRMSNLDPMVARLVTDKKPFAAYKYDNDFAILVEVVPGSVIEIVSNVLTVVKPSKFERCSSTKITPPEIVQSQVAAALPQPVPVPEVEGFVYASTNPKGAADLHKTHFGGNQVSSNTDCVESERIELVSSTGHKFSYKWVHWKSAPAQQQQLLAATEKYRVGLNGDFKTLGINKWHSWLDFHAGTMIEDCAPMISSMKNSGTPYFLAHHWDKYIAIFYTDPTGIVYEAVAKECSQVPDVKAALGDWDFCKSQTLGNAAPPSPVPTATAPTAPAPPPTSAPAPAPAPSQVQVPTVAPSATAAPAPAPTQPAQASATKQQVIAISASEN